jgi:hypothetical protein
MNASETEVRALRDRVYGKPISDKEWLNCKEAWMKDAAWLQSRPREEKNTERAVCATQGNPS